MTTEQAIHILIFDGFADWEPAHALAELRRWGKRVVRTVGFTAESILSMGGLRVVPDLTLAQVRPADIELLLLPGGDLWESEAYPRDTLEALIATLIDMERLVDLWTEHYARLDETARRRLTLEPIYFLAPEA